MYLTGFDSKPLNTLYVDKNLEYHNLLQAYSRTNRVHELTKPFGNIVCYRNLKEKTDEAIKLYSNEDSIDGVLMKDYEHYLNEFKAKLERLYKIAPTYRNVDNLELEEEKKEFVLAFRDLSKIMLILSSFVDFSFKEEVLGISEENYAGYNSKYLGLYEHIKNNRKSQKVSILNDINFDIELMQTDRINVTYIMNLIRDIDLEDSNKQKEDIKIIKKEIERADNKELRLKVDLIEKFLEEVIPNLDNTAVIDNEYENFENKEKDEEIHKFSKKINMENTFIKKEISDYEFSGIIDRRNLNKNVKKPFKEKRKIVDKIMNFIIEISEKYE